MSVKRLHAKKRENTLLAVDNNGTTFQTHMIRSFHEAVARLNLKGELSSNQRAMRSPVETRKLGLSLAKQNTPFDAFLCSNELTALTLISGLEHGGKRLGKDFDLICKQTTEILPILHPMIETVAEDLFRSGQDLASLILNLVKGKDSLELCSLQEPRPVERSGT